MNYEIEKLIKHLNIFPIKHLVYRDFRENKFHVCTKKLIYYLNIFS